MSDSRCPKCSADLTGKPEGHNCGQSNQDRSGAPVIGGPSSAENQKLVASLHQTTTQHTPKREGTDQSNNKPASEPERNLRPASPTPEKQRPAPEDPVAKKSSHEKKGMPATEIENSPITPRVRPNAGIPSSPKDLRDYERAALKFQSKGNNNVLARQYSPVQNTHNYYGQQRIESRIVSLDEITIGLGPRGSRIPGNAAYSVDPYVKRLREEHLLLISCADQSAALGAAHSLLDELGIEGEERLLLDFNRNYSTEKSDLSINFFTQRLTRDPQQLTAVVVDGFPSGARPFLDWLLAKSLPGAIGMQHQLRLHRFILLCLVDHQCLKNYIGESREGVAFAMWNLPFLPPLLRHNYPAHAEYLEREILSQRVAGKWKSSDSELLIEIRSYLESEELPKIVEERRNAPVVTAGSVPIPSFGFKGDQSIEDTLLYVGTYFSDLAPHEFDQVVEWLLGDRTTTIIVKTQKQNAEGKTEIIESETQKPLKDFWKADPDKYLATCQLEAISGTNATVSIRIADETNRKALKAHLERRHSLYLLRQFRELQSRDFLNSTPNISSKGMLLSIEMAIAYPDSFGKDWLLKAVISAQAEGDDVASTATGSVSRFGKNKALERTKRLVRLMLEHPQLEVVVDGLLRDLMSLGMHQTVLFIVRGLQFAPRFDEFHWMKRLLDEGDTSVQDSTYYHLYSYIKKVGIYSVLSTIEVWIPTDKRSVSSYSNSCTYALRILVEYCSEVIETFQTEPRPGPLHHPLFTFADEPSAAENLQRLVSWFFHPAMSLVFAELESVFNDPTPEAYLMPFICELVVEWMFILRDHPTDASETVVDGDSTGMDHSSAATEDVPTLSAGNTRAVLIEKIVSVASKEQQEEMLQYWERLRDFMAIIASLGAGSSDWLEPLEYKDRKAVLARRALVKDLIKGFRTAMRNSRLSRTDSTIVQTGGAFMPV
jgi:hypothetical protein